MTISWRKDRRQFREAKEEIEDAETAHAATDEVVRDERPQHGTRIDEVVLLPERGPWEHQEQEPDLDEKRDEQETTQQNVTPGQWVCGVRVRSACPGRS